MQGFYPEILSEVDEEEIITKLVNVCSNMEGGLSYSELRNMPMRELGLVIAQTNKIVEARNREANRNR